MPLQPSGRVIASLPSSDREMPRARGVPLTAGEWTTLARIASGESQIAPRDLKRLQQLGLVERAMDGPGLTKRGRLTLGLPD
jgi:hypothetical protein